MSSQDLVPEKVIRCAGASVKEACVLLEGSCIKDRTHKLSDSVSVKSSMRGVEAESRITFLL